MTSKRMKKGFFIFIFSFIFAFNFFANESYYFFDLPVGFKQIETEDKDTQLYQHEEFDITLISKIIHVDKNTSVSQTSKTNLEKLGTKFEDEDFTWNNTPGNVGFLEMELDSVPIEGLSLTLELSSEEHLFCLIYTRQDNVEEYFSAIYSALNSLCIDDEYYYTPGPVITFLSSEFRSKPKDYIINLKEAGITIKTKIDENDIENAQINTELEYNLLNKYLNKETVLQAWERYYRIIYRDNYLRIKPQMESIITELKKAAREQKVQNVDLFIAQSLLSWTQGFEYIRAKSANESDFICLPSVLAGNGNDCDSRSFLICAILNEYGIKSILLVSPEYKHAMPAIALNEPGQKFNYNGKDYLMGETTARLTWGTIAAQMQDRTKWFAVSF